MRDASTSGAAETSGMRCSAGLCRDTKPKSLKRPGRKRRLPRQHARNDAATLWLSEPKSQNKPEKRNPSKCRQPAISYTVHTKMHQKVQDLSAGLESDGWRRKYTTSTPSCRLGGPAIANHLIRHDAHNQGPANSRCFCCREQSPRTSRGYLRKKTVFRSGPTKKKPQTHKPAKSTRAKSETARSTSAQPDERQPPAAKPSAT